uniref:Glutathione-S-transferase n=1 Tax=Epiphyas postvittana TaxID=65032 RepID=A0A0K8TVK6_EPIPO
MVLKLYKMDTSPPVRACMMLCDLLNVPVEMIEVDLFKGEHMNPDFVKKNPLHTVPVLEDGDLILQDSHAILMYLAGVYDKQNSLYPKDLKQRALVDQKLFFNISILFMRLRNISYPLLMEQVKPTENRFKDLDEAYGFLELFLSHTKYLAGSNMTIADIAAYATTSSLGFLLELDGHKYPKLQAWMKEMEQLPCATKYNAPGVQKYKEFITGLLAA